MTNSLQPIKFVFLVLLIIGVSNNRIDAQNEKCGFDHILQEKQQDENFLRNRAQMERFIKQFAENSASARTTGSVVIPCVVHVIHTGQAEGTIDNDQAGNNDGANPNDAQINSAISNMTDAFKHTGPYASLNTYYMASMDVTFILAQTAPDGTGTTGIKRYDVSGETWGTDYANNGMDAGFTPGVPQATITAGKFWPPMDYMNIWVVHEVENATTTLGFASFPQMTPGGTDGLTMLATAFGYDPNCGMGGAIPGSILDCGTNLNGTANHETGHYLSLYHTFIGDMGGGTCPADATCGTDSDCCADIDAHKRSSGCPADNPTGNDCPSPGSGPNSYIHNFMDYADDACFHGFSEDQKTRMEATLAGPRLGLCNAIGDGIPAATYPATVAVPSVTNHDATMGVYDVTLNGTTYKSWSSEHDGGYVNRAASATRVFLMFSTMYTMTVQVGVGNTTNNELVNVYIDYDNDGTFTQAGDQIYVTPAGSGKQNGDVFSFNFTTPASSAPPGINNNAVPPASQGLRLRIISDFDDGVNPLPEGHAPSQGGQVEDYTIEFSPPVPVELVDFRAYPKESSILLEWLTASEENNQGYEIQRKEEGSNLDFRIIDWVNGNGTTSEIISYNYTDQDVREGITYYYRLKQIDVDASFEYSNIVSATIRGSVPKLEVYPNPASNQVAIEMNGDFEGNSIIEMFSTSGKLVRSLQMNFNENRRIDVDLRNLPAGVYYIKATGNFGPQVKKVVLNK